ncbi:MAG: GerAB/ArcD/ProY family transporter [Bacillota bacterium]|nr:GerAB/ArcD/ProY family transporter [Bacillota bacterium]
MNGLISARQLMLMILVAKISVMVIFLPVVTGGDARQDAWIAAILATLAGSLFGALMASLAMRFPGKSFGSFAQDVLGGVLGRAAAVLVALSLYGMAVLRSRVLAFIIVSEVMRETPEWVFGLSILVAATYGSTLGPDAMGRASEAIFTIVMGSIVIGIALVLVSRVGPATSLKPVLERGIGPVLGATITPVFYFATSAAMVLALGKYCTEPRRLRGAVVASLLISGVVLTTITALVVTTLGPHTAGHELAPVLALGKAVFFEGILERLDLPLIAVWALGLAFEVTLLLLSSSIILGDAFGLQFRHVAVGLALVAMVLVSLQATTIFDYKQVISPEVTGPLTLVVHVGLVGLVLIVASIRGKGRKDG